MAKVIQHPTPPQGNMGGRSSKKTSKPTNKPIQSIFNTRARTSALLFPNTNQSINQQL